MLTSRIFSQELISRLICRGELNLHGMIRNIPPAKPSHIRRESLQSSLGLLDRLPAELLLLTLDLLDFQSLSRLSRVSLRGKVVVESLPAFREMMQHAPQTLAALGLTRLLKYHSSSLLRQTLRSAECVSCFGFAGFLFLPTCERVCFECLHENRALWMMTRAEAKKCFHLTEKQLKTIPTLYSIPGTYNVKFLISRRRVVRLVSVKQVKQLAITIHGSIETSPELNPASRPTTMTHKQYWRFKRFIEAPLEPPGCDMSRLPDKANDVGDEYCGMGSIRFAFLTDGRADHGVVCKGCVRAQEDYQHKSMPAHVVAELVSPGTHPSRPLSALGVRLRSRDEFVDHVKHCYGVSRFLAEWGENV
ncbi:hypothetical protein NPX13_g5777 [Xylaria arbuscula]|uniref:F-box domain-containing protein n=1 Tax=Xylaria arbuscula TaxID=114810 RepID=A0A9W8ND27_9PEZI|nr:hypothetical protein NPX13_g5777 [Xylaria arbuscula]